MKILAIVPRIFYSNRRLSDRVLHFFTEVERRIGAEVHYADSLPTGALSAAVVIVYTGAHGKRALNEAIRLPRRVQLIVILTGPHNYNREELRPVFDRADVVLCTYGSYMRTRFPEFTGEWRFFPLYFAPHDRYARLPLRDDQERKCLFTGHIQPRLYPLRASLMQLIAAPGPLADVIVRGIHPRWGDRTKALQTEGPLLNEVYARRLNDYACSIATASVYRYGLAKYFEIPAAGCLLLAERTADIYAAGLRAHRHYIPVSATNIGKQILHCASAPELFRRIRDEGTAYVRENHSIRNRITELTEILGGL